jgi:hypothetical protein
MLCCGRTDQGDKAGKLWIALPRTRFSRKGGLISVPEADIITSSGAAFCPAFPLLSRVDEVGGHGRRTNFGCGQGCAATGSGRQKPRVAARCGTYLEPIVVGQFPADH